MPIPAQTYGYEPVQSKPISTGQLTPYLSQQQLLSFEETTAFDDLDLQLADRTISGAGFWRACVAAAFAQATDR